MDINNEESRTHDLSQYGDMEVEVRGKDGAHIFSATLKTAGDGTVYFDNVTADTAPQDDRIPALIRGFSRKDKKTVHMKGTLVKSGGKWISPDLNVVKVVGDRVFFRMKCNTPGTLRSDAGGAYCPCRVRDISNGGVRLTSWGKHSVGDILVLNAEIYDSRADMKCRVIRASGKGPYTYNCAFTGLDDNLRRMLTRNILKAQFN